MPVRGPALRLYGYAMAGLILELGVTRSFQMASSVKPYVWWNSAILAAPRWLDKKDPSDSILAHARNRMPDRCSLHSPLPSR